MREWIEPDKVEISVQFLEAAGGSDLIAQALVKRGITSPQAARAFIDPKDYQRASAYDLIDMSLAVERLARAIDEKQMICVWGDFDVDGQTATALLVSALRLLGGRVIYHVPLRESESHGVNIENLSKILNQQGELNPGEAISILLTCDTGISANAAVEYANQQGVDVIITDHHELPDLLPAALAAVNPQRLAPEHPLRTLPGVGVAYKLVEGLFGHLGRDAECTQFLDLAALGIVADVALQVGDCRYLLQRGLEQLRQTTRLGLLALIESAELVTERLSEEHIGFELAPRLNAIGRLGDARLGVELLVTDDLQQARMLVERLEGLNIQRKLETSHVFQGALAQIEGQPELAKAPVIVLAHPAWPGGVIGIVASRLVERFNKPVVLINAPASGIGRGSARSVPGVNITHLLQANQEILLTFGGHSMAAGFSIDVGRIADLRRGLARSMATIPAPPEAQLEIDGFIQLGELSLELADELERLAPYGAGNPPLILGCRDVRLSASRFVGQAGDHLLATIEDRAGSSQRIIWWQAAGFEIPENRFDLAFTIRASSYRGQRDLQVEWIDYRALPEEEGESSGAWAMTVNDYRLEDHPLQALIRLLSGDNEWQVWAEGEALERLQSALMSEGPEKNLAITRQIIGGRGKMGPASTLVIWTSPASSSILRRVLETVRPKSLVLFASPPGADDANRFLQRLAGLVKHVQTKLSGETTLERLAEACAQSTGCVRSGLDWMESRGYLYFRIDANGQVWIGAAGQTSVQSAEQPEEVDELLHRIGTALAESRAYRAYYTRTSPEALIEGLRV